MAKQYSLESKAESERLDRQSSTKAFDYKSELEFLKIKEGQHILDAGCGSGIVTDYLAKQAKRLQVTGWDFSQDRVDAAQAKYGAKNITFAQKNLLEILDTDQKFDTIVCRFVLRHFNPQDAKKVIQNLSNALKSGGTLYCIDVEGVLADLQRGTPFLKNALRLIRETEAFDFQVARKMPSLLQDHGFKTIDWHVQTAEFKGDELSQEIENLRQSVKNAETFAKTVLGGDESLNRFNTEYFSLLKDSNTVLFYNKVIAVGTKPKTKLKLVD